MHVSQSVKLAGIVVALIVLYFLGKGLIGSSTQTEAETAGPETFTVVAETVSPALWQDEVTIRGRTKADRKVIVRAETAGVIAATPTELGAAVSEGDVLCRLDVDARRARLAEARAALSKARLDYNAAQKLFEDGFRSETGVAAAKAVRDQAAAQVAAAEYELSKTDIKAPFDGVYDERFAEVGDFLKVGDPCATVIQKSPFLVVGAISENDVAKIKKGDRGRAKLATGETIDGVVRFVASGADPSTRTFDVELEVPNEDGSLRDGVTAEFTVYAEESNAHLVPRAALILNDEGEIGLHTLGADNVVAFNPVRLMGESDDGFWVGGLEGEARIIVSGQLFVTPGQHVSAVAEGAPGS